MLHRLTTMTAAKLVDRIISLEGARWWADRVEKLTTIADMKMTFTLSLPRGFFFLTER